MKLDIIFVSISKLFFFCIYNKIEQIIVFSLFIDLFMSPSYYFDYKSSYFCAHEIKFRHTNNISLFS